MSDGSNTNLSTDIRDHLRPDYAPVYGSDVAPASFTYIEPPDGSPTVLGWLTEAVDCDGIPVLCRIVRASQDSSVTTYFAATTSDVGLADPQRRWVPMQHPYTKKLQSDSFLGGALADWVDAIARSDAEGRRALRTGRWNGGDLVASMRRVEHSVVAYRTEEVSCGGDLGVTDLQQWLTKSLEGTSVSVEVGAALKLPDLPEQHFPRAWGTERPLTWMPYPIRANTNPREWFKEVGGPLPTAEIKCSGSVMVSASGVCVLAWSEVVAGVTIDEFESWSAPWWVIHVASTDFALVFPKEMTNVLVEIDNDGATVTLSAISSVRREKHHRRRIAFEKEWGKWLDGDAVLTDHEVRGGIARAEEAVRDAFGSAP